MSVSFNSSNHELSIIGTNGTDNISIKQTGSLLVVNDNGVTHYIATIGIDGIYADAKTGSHDVLAVDPSVKLPCYLFSEGGYKGKFSGGSGNNNDTLISRDGTSGNDFLSGDGGFDVGKKDQGDADSGVEFFLI